MAQKVEIVARNMRLADDLKDYIEKKTAKLDRHLQDHGSRLRPANDVDSEAALRDQVPARLLEQLQVAGVVHVPERVQVQLADRDGLVVQPRHARRYSARGAS